MPIDETKQFVQLNIAVLTISDTRSLADDKSGTTLADRLYAGFDLSMLGAELVPDRIVTAADLARDGLAFPDFYGEDMLLPEGKTPAYLGQAVVAVVAVLAVSGEYGTGMIRTTMAAMPRRITVLTAKAAVVTGLVLVAGAAGVLASVLAGRLILPGRGFTPGHGYPALSLANGADLRAAAGSVLYLALIALLALGIAAAVRDSAASIGVVRSGNRAKHRLDEATRDRKSEAGAGPDTVAFLHAVELVEHALQLRRRHTLPFIDDLQDDSVLIAQAKD